MGNWFSKFKLLDMPLFAVMFLIQLVGLAVLYATSLTNTTLDIFWKQFLFVGIGVCLFFFFTFYNYHSLSKTNRIVYPLLLLVLLFVLIFGREIRGSSRWIDFGFFRFQPAEFAKIVVVVVLARWFAFRQALVGFWRYVFVTIILAFVPFTLVLLEPDLGSAIILGSIWLGMLLLSPVSKKFLALLFLAFIGVAAFGWAFVLEDYQHQRLQVFFNPELDPKGKGYNVRQASIAVGSGKLFGRGLGRGLQSQLKFLPERQTDFIFASAAEEIGYAGTTLLLGLYTVLLYRLIVVLNLAKDYLGRFLAMGVFCVFFCQIVINVGMNMAIMPVTGIPLPFLSYGGSSLLVSYIALGIIQNVAVQSKAMRS